MIVYAVILFVAAALMAVVAVRIYRGRTDLIHNYHQTKVTDQAAYGKAFGKALGVFPVIMTLSAVVSLLGETAMGYAPGILLSGIAIGIIAIIRVQKKYNGGVF